MITRRMRQWHAWMVCASFGVEGLGTFGIAIYRRHTVRMKDTVVGMVHTNVMNGTLVRVKVLLRSKIWAAYI